MSGTLDWDRNSELKFGKYAVYLGLYICKVRHLGVFLYGFEKDMSERIHFKVLHFYLL